MSDPGIKKVFILQKDLPPVSSTNSYRIRYRVVSEDKNRTSHWSPIFNINAQAIVSVSGTVVRNGDAVTATWAHATGQHTYLYDVFTSYDGGAYVYLGSTPVHSFIFLRKGASSVRFIAQAASSLQEINSILTIFDSGTVVLV